MLMFALQNARVCAAAYILAKGMIAVELVTMKRPVALFIGGEINRLQLSDLHIGGLHANVRRFDKHNSWRGVAGTNA